MSDLNTATGLRYDGLDEFKIVAQRCAAETDDNMRKGTGCIPLPWSRGESAFLFSGPDGGLWGIVHEGLGTKNLVADAIEETLGKQFLGPKLYEAIAQDTVAMGVNDLITLGLRPVAVTMHLSVSDDSWFEDEDRVHALANGYANACDQAMCTWAGGETPGLKGIIVPGTAELSCAVVGHNTISLIINPANIQAGDEIVFLASSGIHANGLTKARQVAEKLPKGYATLLKDGRTYGEALLEPTIIYVRCMRELQANAFPLHYAVNVTGHGFRKLGRASQSFRYVIDQLPDPIPQELLLIQEVEHLTDEQMYAAFNMGAGFALYVPEGRSEQAIQILRTCGMKAWKGGYIEAAPKTEVVLQQKKIVYAAESMKIRK